jgi:predicted transcriptional regulator
MQYRSSKQTYLLILGILALEKEYAQYDLPKKIGKHYRTVLRHLQMLEKYGLVHLVRTEPAKKGGKERKIYGLKFFGLIELLKVPHVFNFIDQIANNYADLLPLILGKWRFFKKHKLEDLVIKRLWDAAKKEVSLIAESTETMSEKDLLGFLPSIYHKKAYVTNVISEIKKAQELIVTNLEKIVEQRINRNVLLNFSPWELKEQTEFLSTIKKDNELRGFIESEFQIMEKNLQYWKEWWKTILPLE